MKTLNIKNGFFRRPLVTLVLPVTISSIVLGLAWVAYFSPGINEANEQFLKLKTTVAKTDKALSEMKATERKLNLYRARISTANHLSELNNSERDLVRKLYRINNSGNKLLAIKTNKDTSLLISAKINKPSSFYRFISDLEKEEYIDRLTINKDPDNKKKIELTLYLNKIPGDEL